MATKNASQLPPCPLPDCEGGEHHYPGPCGCDGEMADEVMAVLGDLLPGLLAQAWDEGHRASERDWEMVYNLSTPDEDRQPWTNPYRKKD